MNFLKRPIVAVIGSLVVLSTTVVTADPLSLEEAMQRTAAVHPELRGFAARSRLLGLESARAVKPPPLSVGLEIENMLGTGDYSGLDAAETTLTLAGVLERGGKPAARRALAASRLDELAVQREVKELDVLAEVARRYLDLAEVQASLPLLAAGLDRQRSLAAAVRRRFQEGASPEALALSAEAEIARREAELQRARRGAEVAWRSLALMWSDHAPGTVPAVIGRVRALPELQSLDTLLPSLRQLPDLRSFAQAERVQDARRRVAAAGRSFDLEWQLGVRRLEASGDTALVAGVSLPLGTRSRAALDESIEDVNRELLMSSRETTLAALETMLVRVHGDIAAALDVIRALESQILPRLVKSAAQAERAYSAGALSYFESLQLQNEVMQVELEILALRHAIDRKLVELQRLTGEPIVAGTMQTGEKK
jgi:cobalt-zinc-cadmium efflux system outer membrane protein